MVAQYNMGRQYDDTDNTDPFIMDIPSVENLITEAVFSTANYYNGDPFHSYIAIVTYSWNIQHILLDGVTVSGSWVAYGDGSGMMYTATAVNDGSHVLRNNESSCGFNAWMYANPGEWMAMGTNLGPAGQ